MCNLDHTQSTFFCLKKFLKTLADDQCSSKSKGSIYHIKHMYIQLFSMEVDCPEIWCLIEVSTMLQICTYYVFTLQGRLYLFNLLLILLLLLCVPCPVFWIKLFWALLYFWSSFHLLCNIVLSILLFDGNKINRK